MRLRLRSAQMTEDRIEIALPPFFLNQSRWKSYQDCGRLYGWINIEGLEPDRKRVFLEIGSAIHEAMVVAHEGGGTQEAIDKAIKHADKRFRKGMSGPKLPGDEEVIQDGAATVARLLPAYFQHYGIQGQLWKPLGMELAFCVEVGEGTGIFLVGRIDNLVTFMNGLWLADYKTMSKLDMRDFIKYEIDVQLTAYIYGGTKQLTLDALKRGEKPVFIRGAIIDGMVKTIVPQFHRELYTRSIEDLRDFEKEFCMKTWEIAAKHAIVKGNKALYNLYCDKMYDLGVAEGWKTTFPKNTQQCFRYGTCAFRDLCVKDNDVRRMAFKKREEDYVDAARIASQPLPKGSL